jgi:hypothetical protein
MLARVNVLDEKSSIVDLCRQWNKGGTRIRHFLGWKRERRKT